MDPPHTAARPEPAHRARQMWGAQRGDLDETAFRTAMEHHEQADLAFRAGRVRPL
ncbi:hypothetical protein [Yinghuangia sp. YIM S10712]|uniref:hypothetical protein n=1 Tax=Yinghuangia sp. YIM S10712 TaxID=3436930 RepID=UPI003F5304BA